VSCFVLFNLHFHIHRRVDTHDNNIMGDHLENDVTMNGHCESNASVHEDRKPGEDAVGVVALHHTAEYHFAIKTFKIREKTTPLPKLFEIYFHLDRCGVPVVPVDLQLDTYFAIYNDIARSGFFALKKQHKDTSRAIWFYGLDITHAFGM
jgi:hypothetical protein